MEKSSADDVSTEPQGRGKIVVRAVIKRAKTGEIVDLGVISEGLLRLDVSPDSK